MKISEILSMLNQRRRGGGCAEPLKLKGRFTAVLQHPDGSAEVRQKDNLILDVGYDFVADAVGLTRSRPDAMGFTAVGTGTAESTSDMTGLVAEIERQEATYTHTAGTNVFTFSTYFAPGYATGAITEAGICNAAEDGIFLDRVTFAVINKAADDGLTTNFEFTLGPAAEEETDDTENTDSGD